MFAHPWWRRVFLTREFAVIGALVLVYVLSVMLVPHFGQSTTVYFLFLDMAPILFIAVPMTMVIITGEIDLSVASIVGLSSVTVGLLHDGAGWSIPAAGLGAIVLGVACGFLNGFLVGYVGLPSLAVTIGTLALYRGIAVGLLGTEAKTDFPKDWTTLATKRLFGTHSPVPLIVLVFAVLLLVFVWLLHFSPFGRGTYDVGLNHEAARFAGVNVARTKLWLFILTGAVSGFVGIYYTLRYSSARGDNAEGLELQVIAAVLLGGVSIFGGRGALHGVVAGVLLIGVISSALRLENQTVNVINIVIGVLLVLSVVAPSVLSWVSRVFRSGSPPGQATGLDRPSAAPQQEGEKQ
jgi:rhamnose transport system permease protein